VCWLVTTPSFSGFTQGTSSRSSNTTHIAGLIAFCYPLSTSGSILLGASVTALIIIARRQRVASCPVDCKPPLPLKLHRARKESLHLTATLRLLTDIVVVRGWAAQNGGVYSGVAGAKGTQGTYGAGIYNW
jgi:hypothetical protein